MFKAKRNAEWHYKISIMVNAGMSPEEIAKVKFTTIDVIEKSIAEYKEKTAWYHKEKFIIIRRAVLGNKNEPYSTEEEALNEPVYNYETLSEEEKEIYNSET